MSPPGEDPRALATARAGAGAFAADEASGSCPLEAEGFAVSPGCWLSRVARLMCSCKTACEQDECLFMFVEAS